MKTMGKYFKVYPIKALRAFSGWDVTEQTADDAHVYLQDNYVVTKGIFKGQEVIFEDITPAWVTFCHDQLGFKSPVFAQNTLMHEKGVVLERLPRTTKSAGERLTRVTNYEFDLDHPKPWWRLFEAIYEVPHELDASQLKQVVRQLVTQYDGLRLRIVKDETGYQKFIALADPNVFVKRDISSLSEDMQNHALREIIEEQWASLDFVKNPLLQIVYIDRGPNCSAGLLMIIHHALMDAYSLQLFLSDFEDACRQLIQGKSIDILPPTAAFKAWAEHLDVYCHSDAGKRDFDWWLSLPWERFRLSPVDYPENQIISGVTSNGATQGYYLAREEFVAWGKLSSEETQTLLKVTQVYQVSIMDILFTALALTFYHWQKVNPLFVIFCDNNRYLFDDLNLTRMIGNITSSCPVLLELANEDITDYRSAVNSIKEQLAHIPHRGNPWNWFEKCYPDVIDAQLPNLAHIYFLYNGQTSDIGDRGSSSIFRRITLPPQTIPLMESTQTELQQNPLAFGSVCEIFNGKFQIRWMYKKELHNQSTAETLVKIYLDVLRSFSQSHTGKLDELTILN